MAFLFYILFLYFVSKTECITSCNGDPCNIIPNKAIMTDDIILCPNGINKCVVDCSLYKDQCSSLKIFSSSYQTEIICNNENSCYKTSINIGYDIINNNIKQNNYILNYVHIYCNAKSACKLANIHIDSKLEGAVSVDAYSTDALTDASIYCHTYNAQCFLKCGDKACVDSDFTCQGSRCQCFGYQCPSILYVSLSPTIMTQSPTYPTNIPTANPSELTPAPTIPPTKSTRFPTGRPSWRPTYKPTLPTPSPSNMPTMITIDPTKMPSVSPTDSTPSPSNSPTNSTYAPTGKPSTGTPTETPTPTPTDISEFPTISPSVTPTTSMIYIYLMIYIDYITDILCLCYVILLKDLQQYFGLKILHQIHMKL